MRKKGSPGHTATAGYMAQQSQRISPHGQVAGYVSGHNLNRSPDEFRNRFWGCAATCSGSQKHDVESTSGFSYCSRPLGFFSYENLNCRHRVLTALGIPSLKQHQMTPATDRDHPPHSGCHLHHTHPRLISQILHFPDNFMWWRTDSEACLLYFVAGFQWSFIPVST